MYVVLSLFTCNLTLLWVTGFRISCQYEKEIPTWASSLGQGALQLAVARLGDDVFFLPLHTEQIIE